MKKYLLLLILMSTTIFADNWVSTGLEKLKVNCIVATSSKLIAGTEKGLYLLSSGKGLKKVWVKYEDIPSVPVVDIAINNAPIVRPQKYEISLLLSV